MVHRAERRLRVYPVISWMESHRLPPGVLRIPHRRPLRLPPGSFHSVIWSIPGDGALWLLCSPAIQKVPTAVLNS